MSFDDYAERKKSSLTCANFSRETVLRLGRHNRNEGRRNANEDLCVGCACECDDGGDGSKCEPGEFARRGTRLAGGFCSKHRAGGGRPYRPGSRDSAQRPLVCGG